MRNIFFSGTVGNGPNYVYVLRNGKLVPIISNVNQAGGFAWNGNYTNFYFVDSGKGVVYGYNYDANSGNISMNVYSGIYIKLLIPKIIFTGNQTTVFDIAAYPQYTGTPVDVAVAPDGTLLVAVSGANGANGYVSYTHWVSRLLFYHLG